MRLALYKRIGRTIGTPDFLAPRQILNFYPLIIKNDYHPKLYYDFSKRLPKTTKSIRSADEKLALSDKLF